MLQNRAEPLFGLVEGVLRPFSFGDVLGDSQKTQLATDLDLLRLAECDSCIARLGSKADLPVLQPATLPDFLN